MEGAPLVRCMTWENASTVMGLSAIIWKRDGLDHSISLTPGGWSCSSDFRQPACDHTCVYMWTTWKDLWDAAACMDNPLPELHVCGGAILGHVGGLQPGGPY